MRYTISALFFSIFLGDQTAFGQVDTLYVRHNDTLTLSIDQKFPSTIYWIYEDSLKEVIIHIHLITNTDYPVFVEVSTGDGPLVFFSSNSSKIKVFKDGHCYGELVYVIYEQGNFFRAMGVNFKITESKNGELITTRRNFIWKGMRSD